MCSGNGVHEQIQYAIAIGEVDSEARNQHTPRVVLSTGNV